MNFEDWYNSTFDPIPNENSPTELLDKKRVVIKNLLKRAWNAGWEEGYNQGKDDPNFENEEDWDGIPKSSA